MDEFTGQVCMPAMSGKSGRQLTATVRCPICCIYMQDTNHILCSCSTCMFSNKCIRTFGVKCSSNDPNTSADKQLVPVIAMRMRVTQSPPAQASYAAPRSCSPCAALQKLMSRIADCWEHLAAKSQPEVQGIGHVICKHCQIGRAHV